MANNDNLNKTIPSLFSFPPPLIHAPVSCLPPHHLLSDQDLVNRFLSDRQMTNSPTKKNQTNDSVPIKNDKKSRKKVRTISNQLNHKTKLEIRKQKHQQIDKWQKEVQEKMKQDQLQAYEEKRLTLQLKDVTKRIAESRDMLKKLDNLKKLRLTKRQEEQGNDLGEEEFNKNIDSMKLVWIDALMEYKEEKRNLNLLLNKNSPEEIESLWTEVLFGKVAPKSEKYKKQHLNDFIEIRRDWDKYIVSEKEESASQIPLFWVLPNHKSNEHWSKFHVPANTF